jgi:hypothetical protein
MGHFGAKKIEDNSVDGEDDVHSLTTAFQERYALEIDTPPPMAAAILWSMTPRPLGHSSYKQSKN